MATPIGHALAGYAVYGLAGRKEDRERLGLVLVCVTMAIAPDLDFVPGLLLGRPALFHQGITHSIGFALVVSLVAAAVYRLMRGKGFIGICFLGFLSYMSHLVIDYFGPDTRMPYGIPLLWPISGEYFISPVQVFLGTQHAESTSATTGAWIRGMLHPHNVSAIAWEIVLIAPLILVGRWYRKRTSRRSAAC
ncbi:MAG: metal-dependent hydrolase [Nitrospiria bacterium]